MSHVPQESKSSLAAPATDRYVAWLGQIVGEEVKASDNFLDVGGNSMIAITLNEKLRSEFGFHVPIGDLFDLSIGEAINKSSN